VDPRLAGKIKMGALVGAKRHAEKDIFCRPNQGSTSLRSNNPGCALRASL